MERLVFSPAKVIFYWFSSYPYPSFDKIPLIDHRQRLILCEFVLRRFSRHWNIFNLNDLLALIKPFRKSYQEAWPGLSRLQIRMNVVHHEFLPDSVFLSQIMSHVLEEHPLWNTSFAFQDIRKIWENKMLGASLSEYWIGETKLLLSGNFKILQFDYDRFILKHVHYIGGRWLNKAEVSLLFAIPGVWEYVSQNYSKELRQMLGYQFNELLAWVQGGSLCYHI